MNPVLENLRARKSVRAFEEREVPVALKEQLFDAAAQAPTAGNQQLYTILDITDQALKDRLAVTCDNQPFIAKAPVVLIFCADCLKWYDAYLANGCNARRPGPGDLLLAMADAVIAAQNVVVAAESLGLGSCYIGDILELAETHRELLSLPEYVVPAAMLVLGWPTEQQRQRQKPPRSAQKHFVHENAYRHMRPEELEEMLSCRCGGRPYSEWLTAFWKRKYDSEFSNEMNRSARVYLRDFP